MQGASEVRSGPLRQQWSNVKAQIPKYSPCGPTAVFGYSTAAPYLQLYKAQQTGNISLSTLKEKRENYQALLFSAINRFSSSPLDPCLMMPAEKVGQLAGQQPCAISVVTQRDCINRWKIWEILHVASPVTPSGTARRISFNESALV